MSHISIYDSTNIHSCPWTDSADSLLAKQYLLPLMQEGVNTYIQNAHTELYLLKLKDKFIPITVNDTEYNNCYLLSSYFIVSNMEEKIEITKPLQRLYYKPFVKCFGSFLKALKINKVVIINNWLLTTNPFPNLNEEEIEEIVDFLKKKFPAHYFMIRSINKYQNNEFYNHLKAQNFRLIPCRQVYLYDPKIASVFPTNILRKQKKDSNILKKRNFYVEQVTNLSEEEIGRLLDLYQKVYHEKYTKFSPVYTEKFLHNALKSGYLDLKLLKRDQEIYGVVGFIQKNGFLLTPFFGYDTAVAQDVGIYRMLSSLIIDEINKVNLVSHQGSGAAQFKKWRGFFEEMEYVAIYDRHLPFYRTLFWLLGEKFCSLYYRQKKSKKLEEKQVLANS